MKFRIVLIALFTVVAGITPMLAQQTKDTYTMYVPPTASESMHVPTFFTDGQACLAAERYKVYEPRDTTRLSHWQELVENKEATITSFPFPVCVLEQTAMGHRIIRLPANTPLFVKGGKVVADGRCGNEIFEIFLPPQPERPASPPPPVVVRTPEPEPERPASPPPPVVKQPKHVCPTCTVEVQISPDKKTFRLVAKFSGGYLSGAWYVDGKKIGTGAKYLVSNKHLLELAGKKGEHEIVFKAKDSQGHEVICGKAGIKLVDTKEGRYWVWWIPGLNCAYAWTADIKNWSVGGSIEKLSCVAAGIGSYYVVVHGTVVNLKIWIPGR